VLEHRGDGGRFSAAGDAGDEDEPALESGERPEGIGREPQGLQFGDREVDVTIPTSPRWR
jgi:hypothetical protein